MSGEAVTARRIRSFPSRMRRFLARNGRHGLSAPDADVPTVPAVSLVTPGSAILPDARHTRIINSIFNIYATGPPSSSVATNSEQPTSISHIAGTEYYPGVPMITNVTLPTDLIPTPKTSAGIYVHYLMKMNRGYPLWIPSPNMYLPAVYREAGVSIGDVGIITPEGAFSFLFNICHEATHPINSSMRLPEDFVPYMPSMGVLPIDKFKESSAGSYLAGEALDRIASGDNMFKTSFKTSAAHTALLMMPEAVYVSRLTETIPLKKYVGENIIGWYKFVRTVLGRDVYNGELRVVSGFRKSAGFGIATVANGGSATTGLTFSIDDSWNPITGCRYGWDVTGSAEVKTGPSGDDNRDLQQHITPPEDRHDVIVNQCLFVDTIDFTLAPDKWQRINPNDPVFTSVQQSSPQSTLSQSTQLSPSVGSSGDCMPDSSTSTGRLPDTPIQRLRDKTQLLPSISLSKRLFHPSDIIADFLLRIIPHATSVAVCSDDWRPHMTNGVKNVATLIENTLSFSDICESDGMIFLSPNNHGAVTHYLELTNPFAIQDLPLSSHDNLSVITSAFNGETYQIFTPRFYEIVQTRLIKWNVILAPRMFTRTFLTVVKPLYINIETLHLSQGVTEYSFVGRFTIAALSEMRFDIDFRGAPDGNYTLHSDELGGSVSSSPEDHLSLLLRQISRRFSFKLSPTQLLNLDAALSSIFMTTGETQSPGDNRTQPEDALPHEYVEEQRSTESDDPRVFANREALRSHVYETRELHSGINAPVTAEEYAKSLLQPTSLPMPSEPMYEFMSSPDRRQLYPNTKEGTVLPIVEDKVPRASDHANSSTIMDPNNKSKREILRRSFRKLVSKLGSSSQMQAGPSNLLDAMASTVTNAVTPTVSQAHQSAYYLTPPGWSHSDNPNEVHLRASPYSRISGPKVAVNVNRLTVGPNQDDEKKKRKKIEDNRTGAQE